MKNFFLIVALVSFAVGFSDLGESLFWYLGRPIGAIAFVLYLTFLFLEKEVALFDREMEQCQAAADKQQRRPAPHSNNGWKEKAEAQALG